LRRKLLALNLVLAAAIGAASWRLRLDWIALHTRDGKLHLQTVRAGQPPELKVGPGPQPVPAVNYVDIAQKMVFAKDRNPNVVIEPEKEPPPKLMPPLPLLYGVLNLMDSTTAVMSEKRNAPHQGVRLGEQIGEFTLVSVDREEITLEWDGKPVTKKIDEMLVREAAPAAPAGNNTTARTTPPAPVASQTPPPKADAVPGADVGNGVRACQAGDSSPNGTVANGYRKLVVATPFGAACRWEPI
jgi:hypothetical protein